MAKFIVKAGFKNEEVGMKFQEEIPGGDEIERAYRTYVLTGIAKVLASASVVALSADNTVEGCCKALCEACDC